jgi:chromosome transmission fidelity protein 4
MRESIALGWMQDALGLDLTSDEISSRELAMDKEMIKLLQGAVKEHQLQRAHDLVRLLNHTNSLDTAYKLAEYYHLIGLQEKIRIWKAWKEENDDPREEADLRGSWAGGVELIAPPNELVGHLLGKNTVGGRPQEFKSTSSMFQRRSLLNAVPNYNHNAFARKSDNVSTFSRNFTQTRTQASDLDDVTYPEPSTQELETLGDPTAGYSDNYTSSPPVAEGKRKREDDDMEVDEINVAATKKPRTNNQSANGGDSSVSTKAGRKAAISVPANAKPNPFARNLVPNRSIVKSNTFFEKVDAAEAAVLTKKGE